MTVPRTNVCKTNAISSNISGINLWSKMSVELFSPEEMSVEQMTKAPILVACKCEVKM